MTKDVMISKNQMEHLRAERNCLSEYNDITGKLIGVSNFMNLYK